MKRLLLIAICCLVVKGGLNAEITGVHFTAPSNNDCFVPGDNATFQWDIEGTPIFTPSYKLTIENFGAGGGNYENETVLKFAMVLVPEDAAGKQCNCTVTANDWSTPNHQNCGSGTDSITIGIAGVKLISYVCTAAPIAFDGTKRTCRTGMAFEPTFEVTNVKEEWGNWFCEFVQGVYVQSKIYPLNPDLPPLVHEITEGKWWLDTEDPYDRLSGKGSGLFRADTDDNPGWDEAHPIPDRHLYASKEEYTFKARMYVGCRVPGSSSTRRALGVYEWNHKMVIMFNQDGSCSLDATSSIAPQSGNGSAVDLIPTPFPGKLIIE